MKNEIILYRPDDVAEHFEARVQDETVWLNRNQRIFVDKTNNNKMPWN